MKLLIVDDNAAMRRLIKNILQPLSGEFCECADGADALSAYEAQRPDVVLMDIRMNKLDGIAATRQIKAFDAAAQIVIVTDYNDNDLREAAALAGACGYVLKENLLELPRLLEGMNLSGFGASEISGLS